MNILVQDALRSGAETLATLATRYGIKAAHSKKYPQLVLLKYDQIDSPMGEPIVQECRGLILDEADDWKCIAYPFKKFFNHGEGHAAVIDWSTATVQEKVDGSLIIMYWYDGAWQIATSGTPDASGQVNGLPFTFADLFWKTWNANGYILPEERFQQITYMFELTSPFNRVVCHHAEPEITWLGGRYLYQYAYRELSANNTVIHRPWPKSVRSFPLNSLEDATKTFETMDPLEQEGYVVLDTNFNRIKVKHPGYVALHHMRDGMSAKRLLEIVRSSESDEFLVHFPEWRPAYVQVFAKYTALVNELQAVFDASNHIPVQKDFAAVATRTRCGSALFSLRAGKVTSIKQYLAEIRLDNLAEILGLKEVSL